MLHYTTLHYTNYITLHYTTPHSTTLHLTTLHSTTVHYSKLQYTPLHHTLHYTNYNYNYNYIYNHNTLQNATLHYNYNCTRLFALHCATLHYTTHYTTLRYATLHHTTLHHTTPHHTTLHSNYTTLHYPTLHYNTLHYVTLHSLHHHNCNCNYTKLITPHHNYSSTTTTTTAALHHTTCSSCGWGDRPGDHCNHCNHSKKHSSNHLSVHQWIGSAIRDSQQPISPVGFLFLKLSPPPCAVLLVVQEREYIPVRGFHLVFRSTCSWSSTGWYTSSQKHWESDWKCRGAVRILCWIWPKKCELFLSRICAHRIRIRMCLKLPQMRRAWCQLKRSL